MFDSYEDYMPVQDKPGLSENSPISLNYLQNRTCRTWVHILKYAYRLDQNSRDFDPHVSFESAFLLKRKWLLCNKCGPGSNQVLNVAFRRKCLPTPGVCHSKKYCRRYLLDDAFTPRPIRTRSGFSQTWPEARYFRNFGARPGWPGSCRPLPKFVS